MICLVNESIPSMVLLCVLCDALQCDARMRRQCRSAVD